MHVPPRSRWFHGRVAAPIVARTRLDETVVRRNSDDAASRESFPIPIVVVILRPSASAAAAASRDERAGREDRFQATNT